MKSAMLNAISEKYFIIFWHLVTILATVHADHFNHDDTARSLYLASGSPMAKGGWRPIMSSDTLSAYNFANIIGGHSQTVGHKILTGPALIETKVISPHIVNVSPFTSDIFSSGIISTSTRPIVTRDTNKLTTIAQAYKTSIYPQSGLNMNSPINSYLNPFALPSAPGSYKLGPGYQFDNTMFLKHQQPMLTHRPLYNKIPGQMMLGKRLKHNQMQNHMLQQLSNNNYYQPIQTYQNSIKKPDSYQRPVEYKRPGENFNKPNNVNNQKHVVNPHESLQTQTKTKTQSGQNIAAVTYKPPYTTHFQQFGVKEEQFGPIPSSILGSFSSFGHASMKGRDTNSNTNINKNNYSPSTTTKAPHVSTEIYSALSTDISKVKVLPHESKLNTSNKQATNLKKYNDYTASLTPPPHVSHIPNYNFKDNLPNGSKLDLKSNTNKGNFIPSPPDPLSKNQNAPEILKPQFSKLKQSEQYTYNTNLPTKRPEITSFFEPLSTINPFNSENTNPDNLLVQLPPPYVKNSFNGQPIKTENVPIKDNYQSKHTSNYNSFEDVQYFPPTAGHEFFGSKYKNQEVKDKTPFKGSYEVTETWGSSGETNTQPTLHTWIGPAHSYKQYNTGLKPPPPSFNLRPAHEDRLIPLSYSPIHSKFPEAKKPSYSEVSSVYSTLSDNNKQKTYFSQLENAIEADIKKKRPMGDEEFDLAAPVNVTYKTEEKPKLTTTPAYVEEITTEQYYVKKRIPSRNKYIYETTTEAPASDDDFIDFTTRFETFKEQVSESENDLHQNELPTLSPNKHFKRPLLTTPVYNNDEEITKKKIKNRRRRPSYKTSSTTDSQEDVTYTDSSIRTNRYRTTMSPDVEEVTKIPKPKVRFPQHRTRLTTRPTNQTELTSSAQPTMIPTVPVTFRPRLHSRIRVTTLSPLDFDDSMETTTIRMYKYSENKQSSIMKIAKDNHASRGSSSKYNSLKETPDYSHKQDEKDTPTSDIAINTFSHKYSAQTLKTEPATDLPSSEGSDDADANLISELNIEYTSPSNLDDISNIDTSQTIRSEQLFTEQKLGNRGNTKVDDNSLNKKDPLQHQESISDEIKIASTTPTSFNKANRQKLPGKYDSNRPRFSVKDYRNRLNQYSSTSTEKPSHTSESSVVNTRLRFPNRSRFPSFKDQYGEFKTAGTNASTSTEAPRKKFMPKDPRHRGSMEVEEIEDQEKAETVEKSPLDNEIGSKATSKLRPALRRDPNRVRISTTSEPIPDASEKAPLKPININTYTNLKRPTLNIRKRLLNKNSTADAPEQNATDVTSTSTDNSSEHTEKNESSTEKYTSETAIMKIAKDEKKHPMPEDHTENSSLNQSQRVSDLTLAASKEYNSSGLFKSVSPNTRRVPNYFTIATDDPILPIEAFFPQLNQKKDV